MSISTSSQILEDKIKTIFGTMQALEMEAADLYALYWGQIDSDAAFTALNNADAATKLTKLTKAELVNGVTLVEQIDRFFTNQSLTQGNYLGTLHAVIYGNDEITTSISTAIEAFGERLVDFCQNLLSVFSDAKAALNVYVDAEIADTLGALAGDNVPFYVFSKSDLTLAINLLSGFKKLINNEDLTGVQGDYSSTVAVWRRYL